MKRFIFALLLMFSIPALADNNCDIVNSGLNSEAISKLRIACEQAKLDQKAAEKGVSTADDLTKNLTPEKISAIGQTAHEIAKAIGSAANELGVAVNDFLLTPAGLLVLFGIFWKLFMVQTVGIIGVLVVLWVTRWWFLRILVESYTPVEQTRWWGYKTVTKQVPTYSTFNKMTGDQGGSLFLVAAISLILLAILVFGFIQ